MQCMGIKCACEALDLIDEYWLANGFKVISFQPQLCHLLNLIEAIGEIGWLHDIDAGLQPRPFFARSADTALLVYRPLTR